MKRVDPNFYIILGQNIGKVFEVCKSSTNDSTDRLNEMTDLMRLQFMLETLLKNKLLYTKSIEKPAESALETIRKAIDNINVAPERNLQNVLSVPARNAPLLYDLKNLQTALAQGLPLLNLYSASPQGTHNLDLLIDGAAHSTFGDYIPVIAPQVVQDFDESGKCLAFALYTAAGYHAARACEGMLRSYAEEFITIEKIRKLETMGAIISKLRAVKGNAGPDVRIVDRADRVREYDRNVLMHPGQFLSDFDARSAFAIAGELVNMIAARKQQLGIAKALLPPVNPSELDSSPMEGGS